MFFPKCLHIFSFFSYSTYFTTFLYILLNIKSNPFDAIYFSMLFTTRNDIFCYFESYLLFESRLAINPSSFVRILSKKRASQNREALIVDIRFLTISLRLYFSSGSYRAHRLRHRSKQRYRGIFSKYRKARGSDECL